jgi:hypothetical protein
MKRSNMPLYKAQMGGGTEQNEMNARMATSIQQAIKRGQTPQDVYESLLARKMDQKLAMQLVSSVVKYMMEAGELEEEALDQAEQKDAGEIQAMEQDKMLMQNEEKDAAAQQQMDAYRQQSMAAATDTSASDMAEEEDAASTESIFGFQDGGQQVSYASLYQNADGTDVEEEEEETVSNGKFNLESLIENTAGTQNLNFPGLEQYYMPYNPLASDSLELPDMSMPTAKYGGSHKKQFAKNVMNLLKKQAGGMQEDEVVNSSIAKQTDDLTGTVKKKQSSFVDAVGNTAKKVKIDEWFEKLQETQDPLLEQILSPAPKGDPAQEQQMQIDQAMGQEEMRRGGQKKAKRKYRNLIERTNKLLGVEGAYPSDFGDIPMNTYDKSYPFMQQSFETIDVPTLEKYFSDLANLPSIQQDQALMPIIDVYDTGFFGRPKKYRVFYPQASKGTAEQQAEEATLKNNIENDPKAKVTINETQVNLQTSGDPKDVPSANDLIQGYASGGQYGGFVDPSLPNLTRFVYGGNDFPEEAKNVNDPYFTDMGQYQDGGMTFPNPDEDPENPMHHLSLYSQASDIFHQPMNTVEQAKRGGPTKADARRVRRATNATLRDNLIPINRFIDYEGSYAQQMGMPTIYNSDAIYSGSMTGAPLVFSDVTKRGILGAPKQWTDYYMVEDDGSNVDLSQHPMLQQYQQAAEQGSDDYSDLGIRARRAINKGERQTERQLARAERKGYNEPTPNSKNRSPEEFAASLGYPDVETLKKAINERTIKNFEVPEELGKQIMEYQEGGMPEVEQSPEDENFEFYRRLEKGMYTPPPMMRRGGRLPMAFEGLENTPVSYTSNPAFEGQKEVDFTVNAAGNTNLQPSSFWSNFQPAPVPGAPIQQPEQMNIQPENVEEYQATKSTTAPKMPDPIKSKTLVQVNRQREDMRTVDPEAGLNAFNAASSFGLGIAKTKDQREQERQMYEQNFNPMKFNAIKARKDRGDWEVNQGSYRDPGSNRLGRSKQFGGPMTDSNEDDIMYMTDEQIQQFMAAGGEIEFL